MPQTDVGKRRKTLILRHAFSYKLASLWCDRAMAYLVIRFLRHAFSIYVARRTVYFPNIPS